MKSHNLTNEQKSKGITIKTKKMTPREKAVDLISKFRFINYDFDDIVNIKECALITVNELIDHCSQVEPFLGVDYWNDVKIELENL